MAETRKLLDPPAGMVRNHGPGRSDGPGDDASANGAPAPTKAPRRKRPPITEKGKQRNVKVPDSVWQRLELDSIKRRIDKSKRLTQILDTALPFFDFKETERPPAADGAGGP